MAGQCRCKERAERYQVSKLHSALISLEGRLHKTDGPIASMQRAAWKQVRLVMGQEGLDRCQG